MLGIKEKFPDFELTAVVSTNREKAFQEMRLADLEKRWKIFFFWPKDFTFVCPTEIVGFAKLSTEFLKRNALIVGASTDSDYVHLAWRQKEAELRDCPFPWLSDIKRSLSQSLGILDVCSGVAQRATFIVDPENFIRHVSVNDDKVGRNPEEILRVLDALQTDGLCPCNWQQGENTLETCPIV